MPRFGGLGFGACLASSPLLCMDRSRTHCCLVPSELMVGKPEVTCSGASRVPRRARGRSLPGFWLWTKYQQIGAAFMRMSHELPLMTAVLGGGVGVGKGRCRLAMPVSPGREEHCRYEAH